MLDASAVLALLMPTPVCHSYCVSSFFTGYFVHLFPSLHAEGVDGGREREEGESTIASAIARVSIVPPPLKR